MRLHLATLLALALPAVLHAQKQVVIPEGSRPSATLSPGTRAGDVLYVSGQTGTSRTDPDSSIQGQTKRALANVQKVVEAAGSNMGNVLKCTVFLTDLKDFAGMNSSYTQAFTKEPPARSTVVVAALVSPGAKVEIECIAALPSK
ncbi:MAG TPA: RidA family protein [Gemmatimonadaceae bacterium]|nr:RidA family protein [Gemmatimonadaceae bacterium]